MLGRDQASRTEWRNSPSWIDRWSAAAISFFALRLAGSLLIVDLYIYYRVADENSHRLRDLVLAMQVVLFCFFGVFVCLFCRSEERDGKQTWMEIYSAIPEGFEPARQKAVADAGLMALTVGERHVERFVV